jgi:hypothetical protein
MSIYQTPLVIDLTLQEIFNIVWNRAKDKRKALNNNACVYRSENSLKCFIGELIPDYNYSYSMEGCKATSFMVFPNITNIKAIRDLQLIHDLKDTEDWESELQKFAGQNKLKIMESD